MTWVAACPPPPPPLAPHCGVGLSRELLCKHTQRHVDLVSTTLGNHAQQHVYLVSAAAPHINV